MTAPSVPSTTLDRKDFWALWFTLFLIAYNVSVIPPIMPLLVRQLDTSLGYIQGALVLFSLVTASFAPTSENLCRFYGRERVFVAGLILYGMGTLAMALSPTIGFWVVSFSLWTGLAATPLVSAPWTIMDFAYDGKAEQQATLSFILASVMGGLSGSIMGGLIAANFGWRWSFAPSLLVFLLILALGRTLPATTVPRKVPIDWVGGLISFLGLGSILLGVSLSGEYGWWKPKQTFSIVGVIIPPFALSIVPTLIAVGVICLGFFAVWQRQQDRSTGVSLLRVGLLRNIVFVDGLLTATLHTLITSGVQFNLYQTLPIMLSLNPFQTALAVLPYTLTMVVVIIALLQYLTVDDQLPPKYIVYFGLTLLTIGLLSLYFAIDPASMTTISILPSLIVMGIGSGLFLAYIGTLTYATTSRTEKPEGTGIYNPFQQLGNSLGRGILGTILITSTSAGVVDGVVQMMGVTLSANQRRDAISTLQRMIQTFSKEERRAAIAKALPEPVINQLPSIARFAAAEGIRTALIVAIIISVVCFLLSTQLPKQIRHRH